MNICIKLIDKEGNDELRYTYDAEIVPRVGEFIDILHHDSYNFRVKKVIHNICSKGIEEIQPADIDIIVENWA